MTLLWSIAWLAQQLTTVVLVNLETAAGWWMHPHRRRSR